MVGPDRLALYFDDFFLAEAFPPFRPAAFFCAVVPEASGIALVGTSCADERPTFKGIVVHCQASATKAPSGLRIHFGFGQ
jgi:hypothetical protein